MSIEHRRTKTVYAIIQDLVEQGQPTFRPGDITSALRRRGQPLDIWEVRGEFSILAADGLIQLDAKTATWSMGAVARNEATG